MPTTPSREAPSENQDPERARSDRRRRAKEEALEVRERFERPYRSFEVRNPVHGTHYLVLAPGATADALLLCPCPDFGRRDVGTCKHVEAVRPRLTEPAPPPRPPPSRPASPGWETLEEALAMLPPPPWSDLRSSEAIGRRLCQP